MNHMDCGNQIYKLSGRFDHQLKMLLHRNQRSELHGSDMLSTLNSKKRVLLTNESSSGRPLQKINIGLILYVSLAQKQFISDCDKINSNFMTVCMLFRPVE